MGKTKSTKSTMKQVFVCGNILLLTGLVLYAYKYFIDMKEGELLLFNSEQLHATRLNTSKDTRFVVTVRVIQKRL